MRGSTYNDRSGNEIENAINPPQENGWNNMPGVPGGWPDAYAWLLQSGLFGFNQTDSENTEQNESSAEASNTGAETGTVPRTADDSLLAIWGLLALLGVLGLALGVRYLRLVKANGGQVEGAADRSRKKNRILCLFLCLALALSILGGVALSAGAQMPDLSEPDGSQSEYEEILSELSDAEDPANEESTQPEPVIQDGGASLSQEQRAKLLENAEPVKAESVDRSEFKVQLFDAENSKNDLAEKLNSARPDDEELVRVIIEMDDYSVIENDPNTEPSPASLEQADALEQEQNAMIATIENKILLGEKLQVNYHYSWLVNGIAALVPYGTIEQIKSLPGVRNVILQRQYKPTVPDDTQTSANNDIMPITNSDGPLIGREDAWSAGYSGMGTKIAVIDTGLDDDHPSFAPLSSDKLTDTSATKDTIAAVLSSLNVVERMPSATVADLYRTTKVPFGFNYVDANLRINHEDAQGYHGTHVAGIAAANKVESSEVVGVAPDAQLYIMKVFGEEGGAYTEDFVAAIEDALLLDADVVNMSFGSDAGFTSEMGQEESQWINDVFASVRNTGTILSVAAGNSATSGDSNLWGSNSNLTSNPDNSTIGSPSTYSNALSVASVENLRVMGYGLVVHDKLYIYSEGTGGNHRPMATIAGKEYPYAVVPGFGTEADYAGLDLTGKIALVSRGGGINFYDKCDRAAAAGAIGCIIYNNEPGVIGLDLTGGTSTIPCASITLAAGNEIVSVLQSDPGAKMFISDKMGSAANEEAGRMSTFSSWGATPDLHLEPDITAPGGNIYSTADDGQYEVMSGTSMAAPNFSGITALVQEYVRKNYPVKTDSALHSLVNKLLMSTAVPLPFEGEKNLYYSPRSQGAGVANANNAIQTRATLQVDGIDVPKVELMDDPQKTGAYTYTFKVENFGTKNLKYALSTVVQTEGVLDLTEEIGQKFMSMTPVTLDAKVKTEAYYSFEDYDYNANNKINSHDAYILWLIAQGKREEEGDHRFDVLQEEGKPTEQDVQAYLDELVHKNRKDSTGLDIDLNGSTKKLLKIPNNILTVEAGKTVTVKVSIQVTDKGKAYMDQNFANGIYVEGYTFLTAQDKDSVDLSLPFMGFYGDWSAAPTIDSGNYWDDFGYDYTLYGESDEETPSGSQDINTLFTNAMGGTAGWVPGYNPYVPDEKVDKAHISVSPNDDGSGDYIDNIRISLLRNAKRLSIVYTDDAGEELFRSDVYNIPKTMYNSGYGMTVPFDSIYVADTYHMTDASGAPLPNNSKVKLSVEAQLDYATDTPDVWETDITVDTQAPELKDAAIATTDDGRQLLFLTVSDNLSVAAINVTDKYGINIFSQVTLDDNDPAIAQKTEDGIQYSAVVDVTGVGNNIGIILGDYAFNESAYSLKTSNNNPTLDEGLLYGFRVDDKVYEDKYDTSYYGWVSVDPATGQVKPIVTEYFKEYLLDAAEYVDGYILAAEASGLYGDTLVWIRPGDWDRSYITDLPGFVTDMAFDPTTDYVYVAYGYEEDVAGKTGEYLFAFNPEMPLEDFLEPQPPEGVVDTLTGVTCIAFSEDGTLYGMNNKGELRRIDKDTGLWVGDVLLKTGVVPGEYHYESMTYDEAEDCLYWTGVNGNGGALYKFSGLDEGEKPTMQKVGPLDEMPGGDAMILGLFKPDNRGYDLPDDAELTVFSLFDDTLYDDNLDMVRGNTDAFSVYCDPWYAAPETLKWSSSDESVATVDDFGTITAVGLGEATITVKAETKDGSFEYSGTVTVVMPQADLLAYYSYEDEETFEYKYHWVTFPSYDDDIKTVTQLTKDSTDEYKTAEYIDGYAYTFTYPAFDYETETSKVTFSRVDLTNDDTLFKATTIKEINEDWLIYDLACDPNGHTLYALVEKSQFPDYLEELMTVDLETGNLTKVATLVKTDGDPGELIALAISPDGTFYGVDNNNYFCTLDPESGTIEQIGYLGDDYYGLSDLVCDQKTGDLYALRAGTTLVYINKENGKGSTLRNFSDAELSAMMILPENFPVEAIKQAAQKALFETSDSEEENLGEQSEPTPEPSPDAQPTATPSEQSTPEPSPTATPSEQSTPEPSPSGAPGEETEGQPSDPPTESPVPTEAPSPTGTPSEAPSAEPSPSAAPSAQPAETPAQDPAPTQAPSADPSQAPDNTPSAQPTENPAEEPQTEPSEDPAEEPMEPSRPAEG